MTAEMFVEAVREFVYESAVRSTANGLAQPTGRQPSRQKAALSAWYNGLSADDQEHVVEVARSAAFSAVFGFFAVLDGVRQIEHPIGRGELELRHRSEGGSILLNDFDREFLHDLFAASAAPWIEREP